MKANILTCYLCSPPYDVKQHQIQGHLKRVHKTSSSMKCCKCDFLGSKPEIIAHYKKEHPEGKSHGILQVFVSFVRQKRDPPSDRENNVSAENRANAAIPKPTPASSVAASKQFSKLSIQNTLGSKKSSLGPVKKPNLMTNLKKTVVCGFSSWKQEEVRNQAQNKKSIEPRLPASSSASASSLPLSSRYSASQLKNIQKKKFSSLNKLDYHSSNNSVKKYREPAPMILTKKQNQLQPLKRKLRKQQLQPKQINVAPERVINKGRKISEFDADTEGGTESESQSGSERETESKYYSLSESETATETETETETATETETETETDECRTNTKAKTKPKVKATVKAKTKSKAKNKGKSKAEMRHIIYELSSSPEAESESEQEDEDESLELTIGPDSSVFPYISSKNECDRSSSIYFCIFCDKKYTKFNLALHHIRVHLKFGYHCKYDNYFHLLPSFVQRHIRKEHHGVSEEYKDDHIERRNVNSWIIDFLNEQFTTARLAEEDQVIKSLTPWIQCPICVKAAKCKKKFAIKFTSFRAFERHYWQHTRWWRVDCVLCGASVQRAQQRDHLSEHEIHMKDDNLEIFEVYFHERIDEITSNKLEGILDNKEKEFYARYKWYRDITREFNVKLVPCDYESSYILKNPETSEKPESENVEETMTPKPITNEERTLRKSTESSHTDELSNYSDIESATAMKLAMKILNGGQSPESDHSSIENDSPLNTELVEVSDTQNTPDENNQSIKDKQALNPSKSDAAVGVIVNEKEHEKDNSRKEKQLVEISPNLQNENQEGINSLSTTENVSANTPSSIVNNLPSVGICSPKSTTIPLQNSNVSNDRVLLSPESSLQQMLNESKATTNTCASGQFRVQTLIDSNVDDLISGGSVLDNLLPDTLTQPQNIQPSTQISSNEQTLVSSDSPTLKRHASTSDGPQSKIPKAVEYVLSQMFPKQNEDNNNLISKTNNSVVQSSVPDPTPSSHSPVTSSPTIVSLLKSQPLPQNFCPQVNSDQSIQSPEEDDDICILEARIVSHQQKVNPSRLPMHAVIDLNRLVALLGPINESNFVRNNGASNYSLNQEQVARIKEYILNYNNGTKRILINRGCIPNLYLMSIVNDSFVQLKQIDVSQNNVPSASNYTPPIASRSCAQTPVIQNIANHKSQFVQPASTSNYSQPSNNDNTTNYGPRALTNSSQGVWTPVSHQNIIPQTRVNYIPHPNTQNLVIRTTIVTNPCPPAQSQTLQQTQIQRSQPVQYQTIQQPQYQALQQQQPNIQYQAQFQGVQQLQAQNIQIQQQIQQRFPLQRKPIIVGQVQFPGRSQTPAGQSINAPLNSCPQSANSNIFNRSPSVPAVSTSEYNNPGIHIHPSPPPPYHQHDQHYQHSQHSQPPLASSVKSYSCLQQQSLQQKQNQVQLQQQQQQQHQQQLQQQHQQQSQQHLDQRNFQQQQTNQRQLQHQQQLQQQPSSQQVLQQQLLQQQHTYQQPVPGGVSSIVDHTFTSEFQYQQISKSNGSYSKINTHQGTVITPNRSSLSAPTQNFTTQVSPAVRAPFFSNSHSHSDHMNQSQIPMETNNVINYSPPANWPDNQVSKQNLQEGNDLQTITNFNSSTSFGETYWTPNIFPKDPTY